jgi:N6-adenosine-specific RNA methylase IME4
MLRMANAYRTVVIDPPWQPTLNANTVGRLHDKAGPQRFYDTMSVDEIINTPPRLAAQAHIYLWCLTQHVDWGYRVIRAWGAEPVTLFTWVKPGLGCGRFRCNTEHVLVARYGPSSGNAFGVNLPKYGQATPGTAFNWPRDAHSVKPQEFFSLVESLSPPPRLEMYGRAPRPGWVVWGREATGERAREAFPRRP